MKKHADTTPVLDTVTAPKRAVIYLRVSTTRQASKGDAAEGYSIPQQREYCYRKAQELGAEVVEEFVDRGASARSVDRPELQQMLSWLKDSRELEGNGADLVIVHKIDRLARNRADDVEIIAAIKQAGAELVSVSEHIDDTPGGKLMHGIMASLAEYYSANLSSEAKKGMAQKAKNGGTHGLAPIGYINTLERIAGRDIRSVAIDEERAHHIVWAYETYATGQWSISQIRNELEVRGLLSRETIKHRGTPLSDAQVHRLLKSPYYRGRILYRGEDLEGAHTPLIDDLTWFKVQALLSSRRISGDRSWRHTHHLKGLLVCGRCGSRMGYGPSSSRGNTYHYFFCLGRHTKKTNCKMPYVEESKVEEDVLRIINRQVRISKEDVEVGGKLAHEQLDQELGDDSRAAEHATKRIKQLERDKQKLIDAYLADAIAIEDVKPRQEEMSREIATLKARQADYGRDAEVLHKRLDEVIEMAHSAAQLYKAADGTAKQALLRLLFSALKVELLDDSGQPAVTAQGECNPASEGEVLPVVQAVQTAVKQRPTPVGSGNEKTLSRFFPAEGSNVIHLAGTLRESLK